MHYEFGDLYLEALIHGGAYFLNFMVDSVLSNSIGNLEFIILIFGKLSGWRFLICVVFLYTVEPQIILNRDNSN